MAEYQHPAGDTNLPQRAISLAERVVRCGRRIPLPRPAGPNADKAFFDWLSGEEDIEDVR